jgi:D-glycero-alpha-D-manno-heptose 1-phosphate guanylyltransferase
MKVVILCGGKGSRLRSVVSAVPKPLAPVGSKVFLEILINQLYEIGVREVVLLSGYMHEKISFFLDSYDSKEMKITNIVEENPCGTGGALINAFNLLQDGKYLCINGDTFFKDLNSDDLEIFYKNSIELTAITNDVSEDNKPNRYGNFKISKDRILLPTTATQSFTTCISTGMYVFDKKSFLDLCNYSAPISIEEILLNAINDGRVVSTIKFQKPFIDIGIPGDYYDFVTSHICR